MNSLNDLTLLILICHFLGDFQLQSEILSRDKLKNLRMLWLHSMIHFAIMLPLILSGFMQASSIQIFLLLMLVIFSHFLLDFLKTFLDKKALHMKPLAFIVDQLLHISIILALSEILFVKYSSNFELYWLDRLSINWILLLVLITKPANIAFKILFAKYQYFDPETKTVPGAGAIIGNMERILSAVFLATNQITAIGLIYTAKSIARFKQIEENKKFAEYYLIGTLFSILFVIVIYHLIFI